MYWILMLVGILVWPELTFCVFLFMQGYPVLAIVAFLTTFGSGTKLLLPRLKAKISGTNE